MIGFYTILILGMLLASFGAIMEFRNKKSKCSVLLFSCGLAVEVLNVLFYTYI